jgi:proteic killer suppression protein
VWSDETKINRFCSGGRKWAWIRDGEQIQAKHAKRLRMILTMLNAASHARQMDAPGLRLHPLKGKPEGRWAVDVDENYRVSFRFVEGHAFEVDYGDYH